MRKLSSYLLSSVNGVVSDPFRFGRDGMYDDVIGLLSETINEQDAVLLGRKTYDEWASYWPTAKHDVFREFINPSPKYVVSSSLMAPSWQNTEVISGDVKASINALKQKNGKTIGVHGSLSLVSWLIEQELLDEIRLTVFPTVVGPGTRLFERSSTQHQFLLSESKTSAQGLTYLVYKRLA
ncbi:dihydrofolate reductase [Sphingomonas sp. UYAg733]